MMKQHELTTAWKTGMGILVRVIFLSFLLSILLFPLRGIRSINWMDDWAKILISAIFVIGIVPFLLPFILRWSGLVTRPVDEIDGTGELNEASKRKMRELEAERILAPHNMPMKELFRERDFTRVAYFRGVLEEQGIATIIRNEHLTCSGLTEIPIPEFFPALCVMDDADYERAVLIIRQHLQLQLSSLVDEEKPCAACGEMNPGNFETCWSCGHSFEPSC